MNTTRLNKILVITISIACISYIIPWVVNPATGLTLGAYDLAEWLSLHPATHPSRIPSLLLRGQLLLISLLIALSTDKPLVTAGWWLRTVVVMLLVIAQLPPPEFLSWTADPNQRQQAMLASISFIGSAIALSGSLYLYRIYALVVISGMGVVTVGYSLFTITPFMRDFGLKPQLGIGGIGMTLVYGVLTAVLVVSHMNGNRVTR